MLPKLVSLAGFQQRAGITLEQLQNAAFAGTLPASVGEVDGTPHWLESDVERFIASAGLSKFTDEVTVSAPAHPAPPASLATASPVTRSLAVDDSQLTPLELELIPAIKAMPAKPPYQISHMPPMLAACVPTDLKSYPAELDESKRRDTYTLEQVSDYFSGVSLKMLQKEFGKIKAVGKSGRSALYAHDDVLLIWHRGARTVSPTRAPEGQQRVYRWVDSVRSHLRKRDTGKNAAPLHTSHDVMMLDPAYARASKAAAKRMAQPAVDSEEAPAPVVIEQPAPVQTVSAAEPEKTGWLTERMASDVLDLPLEIIRIIRKDKIGPAFAYRDGTLQYRTIDVEAWKAANLPVIENLKAQKDVWLTIEQTSAVLGMSVASLRRICAPGYKGPNKGPHSVIRDRVSMFKEANVIAWKTHHKFVIERHQRESALRGDAIRAAQKLGVAANKAKAAKRRAEELGLKEPAKRLLDDKPVVAGKKVIKKANPARDKLESSLREAPIGGTALVSGKATMAEKLAKSGSTLGAGLRLP